MLFSSKLIIYRVSQRTYSKNSGNKVLVVAPQLVQQALQHLLLQLQATPSLQQPPPARKAINRSTFSKLPPKPGEGVAAAAAAVAVQVVQVAVQ